MSIDVPLDHAPSRRARAVDEGLSVLGGALFTFGLFLAVSHFANGTSAVQSEPEEIHLVSSLTEPPPPIPRRRPRPRTSPFP